MEKKRNICKVQRLTLLLSRPPLWCSGVLLSEEGLTFSLLLLESLSFMISYCRQNRAITAAGGMFETHNRQEHGHEQQHNFLWANKPKCHVCNRVLLPGELVGCAFFWKLEAVLLLHFAGCSSASSLNPSVNSQSAVCDRLF